MKNTAFKWFRVLVTVLFLIMITSHCTRDKEVLEPLEDKNDTTDTNNVSPCDTATITWTNYVGDIVSTNCAVSGCHVQGNGIPVYDSYSSFMTKVPEPFKTRVLVDQNMPPTTPLPQSTRDSLQMWLDQGSCE